jgi:competence protein ComEC
MAPSKSRIFLGACAAATIGLGFGFGWSMRFLMWPGMVAVAGISIFWQSRWWRAAGIIFAVFVASIWFSLRQVPDSVGQYFGKTTEFIGVISDDPIPSDKSLRFSAAITEINGESKRVRVLVTLPRYPAYQYGDKLVMSGKLVPVSEFNRKSNASAETVFPKISAYEPGHGNLFKKYLYKLKASMLAVTGRILPEPESALLGGILLGTRDFSDELSEQFRTTGTAHIVAISGFNVTIVAGIFDAMLRRFGRKVSFYGSMLGILSLVVITGAQASVVRAGIMGVFVLLAQRAGRMYASMNALLLTSCIMLVQNPKLLVFDLGFQLSFAALAGLLFLQPRMDSAFPSFPLKAHLFPTIAAQITTTPLLLHNFGNFSFVSILTNLLVLPLIPWAMLIGFISVITGFILPAAGMWLGAVSWFLLAYIIKAIEICASLPGAAVSGIPFPLWAVILYYLILIAYLTWKPKRLESSSLS